MTLFLSAGLDHTTILGSQYFLSFSEHIYVLQNTPKKSVTPLLYYFMNPNNFFFSCELSIFFKDHSKILLWRWQKDPNEITLFLIAGKSGVE